jgi:hypothetical protein
MKNAQTDWKSESENNALISLIFLKHKALRITLREKIRKGKEINMARHHGMTKKTKKKKQKRVKKKRQKRRKR